MCYLKLPVTVYLSIISFIHSNEQKRVQKRGPIVVELKNVSKTFNYRDESVSTLKQYFSALFSQKTLKKVHALSDINVTLRKGETLGIIGRNGSGKSTLLNIIMGSIVSDPGGQVTTEGRLLRLALGMGIDRNLSARDNIYVNASILGLSFRKIGSIFQDIIDYADLEDFVDTPVKLFSKGMQQRLLFSIAMYAEADIFLLDEFFGGVGDEDFKMKSDLAFQEKIVEGKTIIIVSHAMRDIMKYCSRVIWIHKGKIRKEGEPKEVIQVYRDHFKKPTI